MSVSLLTPRRSLSELSDVLNASIVVSSLSSTLSSTVAITSLKTSDTSQRSLIIALGPGADPVLAFFTTSCTSFQGGSFVSSGISGGSSATLLKQSTECFSLASSNEYLSEGVLLQPGNFLISLISLLHALFL